MIERARKAEEELMAACRKINSDIPPIIERLRIATAFLIDESLKMARIGQRHQSQEIIKASATSDPMSISDMEASRAEPT